MCGLKAQLVEHRTGIAELTGSSPVEALMFFRLLLSSCLNWKMYRDDQSLLPVSVLSRYAKTSSCMTLIYIRKNNVMETFRTTCLKTITFFFVSRRRFLVEFIEIY